MVNFKLIGSISQVGVKEELQVFNYHIKFFPSIKTWRKGESFVLNLSGTNQINECGEEEQLVVEKRKEDEKEKKMNDFFFFRKQNSQERIGKDVSCLITILFAKPLVIWEAFSEKKTHCNNTKELLEKVSYVSRAKIVSELHLILLNIDSEIC